MANQRIEVLDALKQEMTAAWAYLHAYAELFEHPDPRRMKLLEETAPGFFALIQTALIECVLIRLARLMDPQESGRNKMNKNLSFQRLFCPCSIPPGLAEASAQFAEVCRDWNGAKFQSLMAHRNKVQAHNDLPTINGATPLVSTKMNVADIQLLKELFRHLWGVLKTAHRLLNIPVPPEPIWGALNQLPTAIFSPLSYGLYMGKVLPNQPELFSGMTESEYFEVGRDKILSLVD